MRGPAGRPARQHGGEPARAAVSAPRCGCSTTQACPSDILATLLGELELDAEDLYAGAGFTAFSDLFQLYAAVDAPRLKDRPSLPHPVPGVRARGRRLERDPRRRRPRAPPVPLASTPSPASCSEAAVDPQVLAIKMTLYRVSPASPIAQALRTRGRERQGGRRPRRAAGALRRGGQYPLGARARGGRRARGLSASSVRRPTARRASSCARSADGIRRYCHLATGNYNARTGGVYGDLGLFTCRDSFGEDLTELFNLLTGYTRPPTFHHLLARAGPVCATGSSARIRREADHARAGRPARIIAKMNGLVDRRLIEELYARQPSRGDDRPDRARHLLPAARRARALRRASG